MLFYLIEVNEKAIGFTGVEPNFKGRDELYVHKLYVLPSLHGKGYGRKAIQQISEIAQSFDLEAISLNVNRHNKALDFYQKLGFLIQQEEDIDIGNGYWMNDYVMIKKL